MESMTEECWRDGYALAYQAAVQSCCRTCKLAENLCQQLAEEAVMRAFEEQSRKPFMDCFSFQNGWRYYAGRRIIDDCRKRRTAPVPLGDHDDEIVGRRPDHAMADTVTLDEVPDEIRTRFDHCLEQLSEPGKSVVEVVRQTWIGREQEKILQLDRYRDILRLLWDNERTRVQFQLEHVDFNNPNAPEYQQLRKILHTAGQQLQMCILASTDLATHGRPD